MNPLLQSLLNSSHGTDAMNALQQQGLSPEQAQQALGHVTDHATDLMRNGQVDPSTLANQFSTMGNAAAGGLGGVLSGGGLRGAMEGGLGGMLAGKAGEILAQKTGMDPRTASSVAAIAAPFILKYLHQHAQSEGGPAATANTPNTPTAQPANNPAASQPLSPWKRFL